jgi:hypothetical protein
MPDQHLREPRAKPTTWLVGAHAILIFLWLILLARLLIVDVWDETTGMRLFEDTARSPAELARLVLNNPIGFWRPLPTLVAALQIRLIQNPDMTWPLLRFQNAAALLLALFFLHRALRLWSPPDPATSLLVTALVLFSGSGIIAASWFANIFDVTSFLCIAAGLYVLARGKAVAAGLIFGVGFFCKETTVLILPFLILLVAVRRLDWRQALRAGLPALAFGLLYFMLRSRVIDFGSSKDTHQFLLPHLGDTALSFAESFWWQNMKRDRPEPLGLLFFALPFVFIRGWWTRAMLAGFFAACIVIYWGMFIDYQGDILLHFHNFSGRLYLIPAALIIFLLALERRPIALTLLMLAVGMGGWQTYRDHLRFQRAYASLYQFVERQPTKPVRFFSPANPQIEPRRGFEVGNLPNAPWVLDVRDGSIRPR